MRLHLLIIGTVVLLAATGCRGGPELASEPIATQSGDFGADMVGCMTERGWDVEVAADGGIEGAVPQDQSTQWQADLDACALELGYGGAPQVSREEAASLYDTLVGVAACVEGLGYPVPDPPSKQAFIEELVDYPIASWHPYYAVEESVSDLGRVREECPVS